MESEDSKEHHWQQNVDDAKWHSNTPNMSSLLHSALEKLWPHPYKKIIVTLYKAAAETSLKCMQYWLSHDFRGGLKPTRMWYHTTERYIRWPQSTISVLRTTCSVLRTTFSVLRTNCSLFLTPFSVLLTICSLLRTQAPIVLFSAPGLQKSGWGEEKKWVRRREKMGAEKRKNGCGEEKLYFGATVVIFLLGWG